MPKAKKPKKQPNAKFDYSLNYKELDLRRHPELYTIGLGEQGVLSVEPYKSEILPLWRFKTPDIARQSSSDLQRKFEEYRSEHDFIGMDMTRKFIQMGVTRSRRYANWPGGRKYVGKSKVTVEKGPEDEVKAESARIFGVVLKAVQEDEEYKRMAEAHREQFERPRIKSEPQTESKDTSGTGSARTLRSQVKAEDECKTEDE